MMKFMRHGFFSFFFLSMLVLAGFSLVLTDWTGSFRSGVGNHDIAKMDGDKITQAEFAHLVDRTLRAENVRPDQAFQMGLINQILTSELWQRMLARAGYKYGIAVDDAALLKELQRLAAPVATQEKTTPADVIKRFIAGQGMSEAAFLETMRREIANNLLRQVVAGNAAPSDMMLNDLAAFQHQTRNIEYVMFHDVDITGIVPPDEKTLTAYYDERKAEFMLPERRSFRLATLKRSTLLDGIKVTDAEIATYYNEHKDEMTRPETRQVDTASYKTKAEAEKLVAALKAGDDFIKTAKKTGKPTRAEAQDFAIDESLPETMKSVGTAKIGDVIGPLETPFGWNVIRVKGITPAGAETLDQAKKKIEATLRDEKLSDIVDARLDQLDQAHETNTAFDEIVKANIMNVTTFDNVGRDGLDPENNNTAKDLGTNKSTILTSAFSMTDTGRASPPVEFQNGDIGVLVIDAIVPAKPKDLSLVRDQLVKDWMAAERKKANVMSLQAALPNLVSGKNTIADIAEEKGRSVEKLSNVTRDKKDIPDAFDPAAWTRVFDANVGKVVFQTVPNGVILAVAKSATLPESGALRPEELDTLRTETARAIREEQTTQYLGALNDRYNTKVNDRLLRQMYTPKAEQE